MTFILFKQKFRVFTLYFEEDEREPKKDSRVLTSGKLEREAAVSLMAVDVYVIALRISSAVDHQHHALMFSEFQKRDTQPQSPHHFVHSSVEHQTNDRL